MIATDEQVKAAAQAMKDMCRKEGAMPFSENDGAWKDLARTAIEAAMEVDADGTLS